MTRRFLTFIACAVFAMLAGCATSTGPQNLADVIAADPQLSGASKLLVDSGVAETLRGPGPYTIFVPNNDAIQAAPVAMSKRLGDAAEAKNVMIYHVVPGTLLATEASNRSIKSLQGSPLALSRAGSFVTVEDAVVIQSDIIATNGVVHVIDRVLTPPKR